MRRWDLPPTKSLKCVGKCRILITDVNVLRQLNQIHYNNVLETTLAASYTISLTAEKVPLCFEIALLA